jgi:hypothetical protein
MILFPLKKKINPVIKRTVAKQAAVGHELIGFTDRIQVLSGK